MDLLSPGHDSRRILRVDAPVGQPLEQDARGTGEPDGDRLKYHWFVYREPGTYPGLPKIEQADSMRATLNIPADAVGKSITSLWRSRMTANRR